MSPAPSLSRPQAAVPAEPRRPAAGRTATGAALAALLVHFWGLYRDHGPPAFRWLPHADKVEHLLGFGLPCLLVLLALHLHAGSAGRLLRARTVALVAGLFVVHAGVSEVVQGELYTTRSGDPYDALADLSGTALGLLGYLLVRRRSTSAGEGRDDGRGRRGRA